MTVASSVNRKDYNGDGVTTTPFAFPYYFFADGDLTVILTDTATGVETPQTLNTHYTVTGAGDESGGFISFVTAPAVGKRITILRIVSAVQGQDYVENDDLPAERFEEGLDRLTMIVQQLDEVDARSLHFPRGDITAAELPNKSARANKIQGFDANGAIALHTPDNAGNTSTSLVTATGSTSARSLADRFAEVFNVKDFGAAGDGISDDTAAFQAAHDAMPGSGGMLVAPRGTYKLSTVNITKPCIILGLGSSESAVTFTTASATAVMFNVTNTAGVSFENFKITASVTRTAGAFINFANVSRAEVRAFFIEKYYIGIECDGGSEFRISNGSLFDGTPGATSAGSAAIRLGETSYTGSTTIRDLYIKCQNSGAQCSYGVRAKYVDVLAIAATTIISHGRNLSIAPGNGQTASLVYSDSVVYDTAVIGIAIEPTGTGKVIRSSFDKAWSGQMSVSGLFIDGAAGTTDGITIAHSTFITNTECGINIDGANAKNVIIAESVFADNDIAGVRLNGSCVNVRVVGNEIGAAANAGQNATGVSIGAGVTGELTNNNFGVNGTDLSSAATGVEVRDNRGLASQQGVWTAWAPAITSITGALTTVSAAGRYRQIDKSVSFTVSITITTNGTGATGINLPLPVNANVAATANGRGTAVSGKQLQGFVAAAAGTMAVYNFDGTYPGASGEVLVVSGTYEAA